MYKTSKVVLAIIMAAAMAAGSSNRTMAADEASVNVDTRQAAEGIIPGKWRVSIRV